MYPVYKPGNTTGLRYLNQKPGDIIAESGDSKISDFGIETQSGIIVEVRVPHGKVLGLAQKVIEFVRSLEKDL